MTRFFLAGLATLFLAARVARAMEPDGPTPGLRLGELLALGGTRTAPKGRIGSLQPRCRAGRASTTKRTRAIFPRQNGRSAP